MTPQLALIVSILFISIALLIDKKKSDVSIALWVPTIWVMYSSSKPIFYWFNQNLSAISEIDYTAGSPIDRLFLSIMILLGIVVLFRRKVGFTEIIKSNRWIFVLFFYMGISIFWSDYMQVSLKRWVRVTGDLVMVLIILTETDSIQAITRIFRRCAYILITLSALTIKYFRHIGIRYDHRANESWVGITSGKNELGQVCFFFTLFFLWILIKKHMKRQLLNDKIQLSIDIFLIIIALWILQGSPTVNSATAFALFIMGTLCLIVLIKLKPNPKMLGSVAVISLFVFFSIDLLVNIIFNMGLLELVILSLGRDMTLTGRTDIWNDLMAIGYKNPSFGSGYGSFWIGNLTHDLWDKYPFEVKSAHNGYLDVFLELGVVGLFLLITVIFVAYRNIKETLLVNYEFGAFKLTLLITIGIYNFSESQFLIATSLLSCIFLLIAVNIPQNTNTANLSKISNNFDS